jgi:hypothetical protein
VVSWPHGKAVAETGRGAVGVGEAPRLGGLENTTMTTEQKIVRAKVGLLELAKQLDNGARVLLGVVASLIWAIGGTIDGHGMRPLTASRCLWARG